MGNCCNAENDAKSEMNMPSRGSKNKSKGEDLIKEIETSSKLDKMQIIYLITKM